MDRNTITIRTWVVVLFVILFFANLLAASGWRVRYGDLVEACDR